jgi:LPXTG-motif cell wall-anchored protein
LIPTGIAGSTRFVPDQPEGTVEVTFAVPADSPLRGHVVVVYQRLAVAASGRTVALHADPDAAEQTIRFADVAPATTTTTTTTDGPATTAEPVATIATTTTITTAAAPATPTSPPPSPPSSPPSSPPPATAPARPVLPRTGSSGVQAPALAGVALVVLGLTMLASVSRRRPPRSTTGAT